MAKLAALAAILFGLPQVGEDLEALLARMEKRVEGIQDLRASIVYTYFDTDPRTRQRRAKKAVEGTLAYRSPSAAAWTLRPTAEATGWQAFAGWLDREAGLRGAVDASELRLHVPWVLHIPDDFGGLQEREHHGIRFFRAPFDTHTPAPLPLLAKPPFRAPVLSLFEISPRAWLARLPGLKLDRAKEEGGKKYYVLSTQPADGRDAARVDEGRRLRDDTWMRGEIWVDAADASIHQVVMEYENASGAPRHRRAFTFTYSQRVHGVATLISLPWGHAELKDLKVNGGVGADEVTIRVPPGAVVRDWIAQPQEVYENRLKENPKDVAAWMGMGTLRYRLQDYAGAVAAFRGAAEARPEAEEPYVALSYFLKVRTVADRVEEFLEKAAASGMKAPLARWALAHRLAEEYGPARARPHFEAVLEVLGEEPQVLAAMLSLSRASRSEDARREYFRLFKAEIARGRSAPEGLSRWEILRPSSEERLELVQMYEEVLAAGKEHFWMRDRLSQLYASLRRPQDANRHAVAMGEWAVAGDSAAHYGAYRAVEILLSQKDIAAAERIQAAFAAKPGDDARTHARNLEIEIVAVKAAPEQLKAFIDQRVRPEWNERERFRGSPTYNRLMHSLRAQKRVEPVARLFLEALKDDENKTFYGHLVESMAREYLLHPASQQIEFALKEKLSGKPAGAAAILNLANQLVADKRWKEAAEKAEAALALEDLTPPQRSWAESLLAQSLVALGSFEKAAEACGRGLKENAVASSRARFREILGQALVGMGKGREAAEAYARAFIELEGEKYAESRWRQWLEMKRRFSAPARLKAGAEEAARAAPADPGVRLVQALVLDQGAERAAAADAMEAALAGWADHPILLRELCRLRAAAGDPERAIAARLAFLSAREKHLRPLQGLRLDRTLELDGWIVGALEVRNDAGLLRSFAERLVAESAPFAYLDRILVFLQDEAFIEKIRASLLANARSDLDRANFRHLVAGVYHELGQTEKAIEIYREVAEGQGGFAPYAKTAKVAIARWEEEAKERTDYLGLLRSRADRIPPGSDETAALSELIHEIAQGRGMVWLNRAWRAELRKEKPDLLFVKVAALLSPRGEERFECLSKVAAAKGTRPEWRLRLGSVLVSQGRDEEAIDLFLEILKREASDSHARDSVGRALLVYIHGLRKADRPRLAQALDDAGAHRWAWELREFFLTSPEGVARFAQKWRAAAPPGPEKARAAFEAARALRALGRKGEALEEAAEAGRQEGTEAFYRTQIVELRLELLAELGKVPELAAALASWLGEGRYGTYEVERWLGVAGRLKKEELEDFIATLDREARGAPPTAGSVCFRSRLDLMAGREKEARGRLEEGFGKFPDHPWLLRELAALRIRGKDFKGGAEALEKFFKTADAPGEWWLRLELARCYAKSDRRPEAGRLLRSLDTRHLLRFLAQCAEELDLHEEIVFFGRKLLEQNPKEDFHRLSIARALGALGKADEAEAEYRILLKKEGMARRTAIAKLFELAAAHGRPGDIAGVIVEAVREEKDVPSALFTVESLLGGLRPEQAKEVVAAWDKAASRAGDVPLVHLAGARLILRWGQPAAAAERLLRAEKNFPKNPWFPKEAAPALDRAGRGIEAAAAYERAAELDPEGKETRSAPRQLRGLALNLYLRQQRWPDAVRLCALLAAGGDSVGGTVAHLLEEMGEDFWREWFKSRRHLKPPEAEAGKEIAAQVELLTDDDIEKRTAAEAALIKTGAPALGPLTGLLESGDLDLRGRARRTLESILRK